MASARRSNSACCPLASAAAKLIKDEQTIAVNMILLSFVNQNILTFLLFFGG